MSVTTATELPARALDGARRRRLRAGVWLPALVVASALLRLEAQRAGYWIDEGLSVGIASHRLADLPGLLRQDGSPPLYYALLHVWIAIGGTGEVWTHALSLLFALATVPAAWWAGRSLFGARAGWFCAVIAAVNPFLTVYGRETRMYTLVALLGLLATATFLHAFAFGRRRFVPAFAAALVLLLYTHTWAVFFTMGAAAALVPCLLARSDRRRALVDAAAAFGAAAVAFAPWVPTLLYQRVHTGAPWAGTPHIRQPLSEVSAVLGDERALVALLVAGAAGLGGLAWRPLGRAAAAVVACVAMVVVPLAVAWVSAQVQPAWATRYVAVVVGPLIVVAGTALARARGQGVLALAMILLFWTHPLGRLTGVRPAQALDHKSNVREVSAVVAPLLRPGDLVVSTQPEQVPVLAHYLPAGLAFADPRGRVADPGVMDWRNAVDDMRDATVDGDLAPLVERLDPGARLLVVAPILRSRPDAATWLRLVDRCSRAWLRALAEDHRLTPIVRLHSPKTRGFSGTPVLARVYERSAGT